MASRAGSAPTIVDVAEQAGVSIKTVSRVLNHEAGVQDKTRAQVLKAVAALKYRPNLSARSLAGAKSFLIGLLYYDPSAAFVGGVQQGATRRCREAGYHLMVESLHNDAPDLDLQLEHMIAALRPDGMILTPPLCDNAKILATLLNAQTPCVLVSPRDVLPSQASVQIDDVHAAEEVTNLLLNLGHQHIAFVKGPDDQAASARRFEGFERAMRARGQALEASLVQAGDFTFPSGVAAANHLLSLPVRPTAVFAANDDMALGVLAAAQRLGLQVPADLSIAGFDDSPAASLVWPPLTTVRQPMAEMARAAVEMLLAPNRADGETTASPPQQRVLPYTLIVRDSTCAPRAAAAPRSQRVR